MSTYACSDTPLTATRGRPQVWPMTWQAPDETPIDITGMTITAKLAWGDGDPIALVVGAGITMVDAAAGAFKVAVTADQTASLPLGRIAELSVGITDSAGQAHDFDFPVVGRVA